MQSRAGLLVRWRQRKTAIQGLFRSTEFVQMIVSLTEVTVCFSPLRIHRDRFLELCDGGRVLRRSGIPNAQVQETLRAGPRRLREGVEILPGGFLFSDF